VPPLMLAQLAKHGSVVAIERVPRDVRQLAQGADGSAASATRPRSRQGHESAFESLSCGRACHRK
jgi:hypothetical protein